MVLEIRHDVVFDVVGILSIGAGAKRHSFVLEPFGEEVREKHICIFHKVVRVKFFACFEQYCLRPLLIAFDRQPGANGFAFAFSILAFPAQDHLIVTILFSQVSCYHCFPPSKQ